MLRPAKRIVFYLILVQIFDIFTVTGNSTSGLLKQTNEAISRYFIIIGGVLLILLSVFGNIIVFLVFFGDKCFRRKNNFFIISLATADMIISAFVMPFSIVNDLKQGIFGDITCSFWICMDILSSTASIFSIFGVAIERYLYVSDPFRYRCQITGKTIKIGVGGVWALSALVSMLPMFPGIHTPSNRTTAGISFEEAEVLPKCTFQLTPLYAIFSSFFSFFIPCAMMIFINYRIYKIATRHTRKRRWIAASQNAMVWVLPSVDHRPTPPPPPPSYKSNMKTVKTVGIIMGSFLICWLPFFYLNVLMALCKSCVSGNTFKAATWLGYLNSAVNPFIYSVQNRKFRVAARRILTRR